MNLLNIGVRRLTTISNSKQFRLSPAARHIIQSKYLDLSSNITASGKSGRILTKSDVILGLKSGIITKRSNSTNQSPIITFSPPKPVEIPSISIDKVNDRYIDIPNSNIRKVIAKRLTESKATVPHLYTSIECEIDELLSLRKSIKKDFDVNVSVNDLVIKSAALALRDVPEAFAKWNKNTLRAELSDSIDISVAVATPTGLITPIVTKADKRGIADINTVVKDLATRARDGKLKPEEFQGGSFSVSNLGMFGVTSFSAVINPPQSCILAVGSGISKVVPPNKPGSKPRVVTTVTVQLSGDRRVIDESIASQFLQVFQSYLSNPKTLLL
mmetsp:Transcript_6201/g.5541  ORF Transcript_6201/g.5541 Transcript_6201/m.5541 type:complete len:329 (-) Transcript_6201:3679-4665(-)